MASNDLFSVALGAHRAGQLDRAEQLYRQLLANQPQHADAWHLLGALYLQRGQYQLATRLIDKSLGIVPDNPDALSNLAVALQADGRLDAALLAADRALSYRPKSPDALNNRGSILKEMRRLPEALACFDQVLAINSSIAAAHFNRASVLLQARQTDAARSAYQQALRLSPTSHGAWHDLGVLEGRSGNFEQAERCYRQALQLQPDRPRTAGHLLYLLAVQNRWQQIDALQAAIAESIERGQPASESFPLLALPSGAERLLRAARLQVALECRNASSTMPPPRSKPKGEKLRVGYFSGDFHNHPVAHLLTQTIELHDRDLFEVVAISFGPNTDDEWQLRLTKAFDRFIDVRNLSDSAIATLARELQLDIAVDLKGHTEDARIGIFAHRPAPIQVNYLGYPGTLGADFIDYIIADPVVIPKEHFNYYAEKVVWLPDSFLPNDTTKELAPLPSRTEVGLPEGGFVFCCFNTNYKISRDVFDIWMRILRQVEGSVLWFRFGTDVAMNNLRAEAELRNIAADRLIFAQHVPLAEHLARYGAADLFLDTFHYNAHTTASDALWAGLPVLTKIGDSFASRVAASLLSAAGLHELIVDSAAAYESLAVELARSPARLAELRSRLGRHQTALPLFDCPRYARNLERAYLEMWQRHEAKLPPDHITIEP